MQHCEKAPPEDRPETYAFVQISDRGLKSKSERDAESELEANLDTGPDASLETDENRDPDVSEYIFSGWMFASSPGLSSLEHSVYDIWVRDCSDRALRTD